MKRSELSARGGIPTRRTNYNIDKGGEIYGTTGSNWYISDSM